MSAFFEDQADPTLQGLLLIGEAGSGKSALAATVVAEYASSFATVARGAAYPSLQHLPFGLITGLIQSLLGLPAPSVSREDLQKIEITLAPLLGEQWEALRPALHYLLHSPETGVQARLRLLPADQLRHQLFWALRRLVKAIAQKGPLLLFVENLQWADDQSLDFLSSLPSIETGTAERERVIRALFPDLSEEDRKRILVASQGNLLYLRGVAEEFDQRDFQHPTSKRMCNMRRGGDSYNESRRYVSFDPSRSSKPCMLLSIPRHVLDGILKLHALSSVSGLLPTPGGLRFWQRIISGAPIRTKRSNTCYKQGNLQRSNTPTEKPLCFLRGHMNWRRRIKKTRARCANWRLR